MVELLVTYMEMTATPAGAPLPPPRPDAQVAREALAPEAYRALYRAIGEPVQWDEHLLLSPQALEAFLADPAIELFVLRLTGEAAGLCELDRSGAPDVEIKHFGLVPAAQGQRLGPFLLDWALRAAWADGARRVWLHTDSNDHPKARQTYERAGFRVCQERWERFPD
ncbi:MAG: GNAT family N-acetyltransferase [Kiloniellales bacterium]